MGLGVSAPVMDQSRSVMCAGRSFGSALPPRAEIHLKEDRAGEFFRLLPWNRSGREFAKIV